MHIHPFVVGGSARIAGGGAAGNEAISGMRRIACRSIPSAFAGHDQSIVEILHLVDRAFAGNRLAALAQLANTGTLLKNRVLKPDLRQGAFLRLIVTDRPADIFKARVLHPELIGIVRIDIDSLRHIAEHIADQRQPRFMLADGRLPLALKHPNQSA